MKIRKLLLHGGKKKTIYNSFNDIEVGVYTDQKWIDFIPSFIQTQYIYIIRNIGCNVAPWNFYERKIKKSNGHFL